MFSGLFIIVVLAVGVLFGAYIIPYTITKKCGKIPMCIVVGAYSVYVVEIIQGAIELIRDGIFLTDPVIYTGVTMFLIGVYVAGIIGVIRGCAKRDWIW